MREIEGEKEEDYWDRRGVEVDWKTWEWVRAWGAALIDAEYVSVMPLLCDLADDRAKAITEIIY